MGDFRLDFGEAPVTRLDSPRLQSLLAYLLLHRDAPQSRQHLAFLLYPDSTEPQARTNLRKHVHLLRHALPGSDNFISADGQTLQWRSDAPFTLDVDEFKRAAEQASSSSSLRETVNLYHGELLPGCYDDWVLPERERLQQKFVETLERLILLLENEGEFRAAISYAERLLHQDSLREDTYRLLMRLHALSGDRAGVVRVYHTCVTVLQRELGQEPSQLTHDAYEQLLKLQVTTVSQPLPRVPSNNLPIPLSSFIGREREMAEIKRLLATTRFLTLTGAGGCGKTRLALEVAKDEVGAFTDGVWFVDLAPLFDPALVPHAVASALRLREQAGRALTDTLVDYLQSKEVLVLLDNCEHLLEACARISESLLTGCPDLRILATSRQVFNIAGEMTWIVPSLGLPAAQLMGPENVDEETLAAVAHSGAVCLFVERARAGKSDFELTKHNARAVARICEWLDGIPLALELAAARIKLLTPEHLAARLHDRFTLITTGSRTALPRHQTLRACIDWSYDLLPAETQKVFRRLSVFLGGFTLEAAEAVSSDAELPASAVLDLLSRLVDRSLVNVEQQGGNERYRQLETIREYASEKLSESGESPAVRTRHLDFFLQLAEQAEPMLKGAEQIAWSKRLQGDYDNLRAALAWAFETDTERALRLAWALRWFFFRHGYVVEGRKWAARLIAQTDTWGRTAQRARVLNLAGMLAFWQWDIFDAHSLFESSLSIAREAPDTRGIAFALLWLGRVEGLRADPQIAKAARPLLNESLALFRSLGDVWHCAFALHQLGVLAFQQGDAESSRTFFEESIARFRALGDRHTLTSSLLALAELARWGGDYARARALQEEALAIGRELPYSSALHMMMTFNLGMTLLREGDTIRSRALFQESLSIGRDHRYKFRALPLLGLAGLLTVKGEPERAARVFGAFEALREGMVMSGKLDPSDRMDYDHYVALARAQQDEAAFEAAWAKGRAMTLDQAVECALRAITDG